MPRSADQADSKTNEAVAGALRSQIGELPRDESLIPYVTTGANCDERWRFYCEHLVEAIDSALSRGKRVVVVTEPYIGDIYIDQQRHLAAMLQVRYANRPDAHHVNLGLSVDLRDPNLCWDGMHLTEEGNRRIADALAKFLIPLLRRQTVDGLATRAGPPTGVTGNYSGQ